MDPQAQSHFDAGVRASLEGRDADALFAFDACLAREPGHPGALGGRGMSLARLGRPEEALESFRRAAAREPGFAEFHRQIGLCQLELAQVPAAVAALNEALRLEPNPEYRQRAALEVYNLGGGLVARADRARADDPHEARRLALHARAVFEVALGLAPTMAEAADALAIVARTLGDEAERQRYQTLAARLHRL